MTHCRTTLSLSLSVRLCASKIISELLVRLMPLHSRAA